MAQSNRPQKRPAAPRPPKPNGLAASWPAFRTEMWAIDRLNPYGHNPRVHTDEQVGQIAASMRKFGWTMPVLIDRNGEVIAGHGRILAARQIGIEEVPCVIAEGWSEADRRAYRIADNKLTEAASWDQVMLASEFHFLNSQGYDLGLTGFGSDELDALMRPAGDDEGITPAGQGSGVLAERFGIPPFSVLNAMGGWWQARKQAWIALGIESEIGRAGAAPGGSAMPAMDGSGKRGDSHGRPVPGTAPRKSRRRPAPQAPRSAA